MPRGPVWTLPWQIGNGRVTITACCTLPSVTRLVTKNGRLEKVRSAQEIVGPEVSARGSGGSWENEIAKLDTPMGL